MLKRSVFILLSVLFVLSVNAQVKQEVIASAGGYDVKGGLSISWTLGETIIPTFTNGNLVLSHGFQQQLIVTAIEEHMDIAVNNSFNILIIKKITKLAKFHIFNFYLIIYNIQNNHVNS